MHLVCRTWGLLLVVAFVGCGSSEPTDGKGPGVSDREASTSQVDLPSVADLPARADGVAVAYEYQAAIHCRRTSALPDGQQNVVDEQTQFACAWQWQGNEAELVLHRIDFEVTADDQLAMKSSMSRSRRVIEQDGVTVDEAFEDLNPQWQEVLEGSFDTSLCRLVVDDQRNQLQRTITDRPGAKMVIDRGIVANSQLFQGPFPAGKDSWEATAEIAVPHYARGTLTYAIADPQTTADEDLVQVHVSGTLTAPPEADSSEVGNVRYTLDGMMVYSRRMRAWIAGNVEAELAFDEFMMEQKIPTQGKATLTMKLLSSEVIDAAGK